MPDIRERVEADRGLLKKIQLRVPGYAGYRRREDIRAADNILRMQLSDQIKGMRSELEDIRDGRAMDGDTAGLSNLGNEIFRLQGIEAKVRHAEGGYSGISTMIRIEEEELDSLYEYDYSMIAALDEAAMHIPPIREANDEKGLAKAVRDFDKYVKTFEDAWATRIEMITGTKAR